MSLNNENQEGHYDDTKIVGKGNDGAMQMTYCAILGVVMILGGVLLGVYLNTQIAFGFLLGIPVVVAGIVVPFLLLMNVARNKVEEPKSE